MSNMVTNLEALLGLGREAASLTFLQVSLRGVVVFVATLVIVRCGDRRFLSQKTAFDAVLGFILASMLARAVNGTAALFRRSAGGLASAFFHALLPFCFRGPHPFVLLFRDGGASSFRAASF